MTDRCIACGVRFQSGDRYLPDISGGSIHFECCGPEPEGFVNLDTGAPLASPPEPRVWSATPAPPVTVADWIRRAMRFIDLADADAAGYDDLHEDAASLTAAGYSLFGLSVDDETTCIAALKHQELAAIAPPTALEPQPSPWAWHAGRDEEWFNLAGPCSTRDDAIAEGRDSADGEGFFIVEATRTAVRFSARRLIDDQYFDADDYFSPEHGDDPDRIGNCAAADAELQTFLDAWAAKHAATFVTPSIFAAQRNLEWVPAEEGSEQ